MKKIGTYLIIGLLLFIGLQSFFHNSISIDDYILLVKTNDNGQEDRVILTPKMEMIYFKRYQDITEVGIYKIKGEMASHYLFGLYCFGSFPLGLRYYQNAEYVFDSELVLTKKKGDSFRKPGDSFNSKIIVFKDKAVLGKISFKRIFLNKNEKDTLNQTIIQLKSSLN